jgi:hypothetical protein
VVKSKASKPDVWDELESVVREVSDLPTFATEDERLALVGRVVDIVRVRSGATRYGPTWFVDIDCEFGRRTLAISQGIPGRDALITTLQDRTDNGPVPARFVRRNRTYWFERP